MECDRKCESIYPGLSGLSAFDDLVGVEHLPEDTKVMRLKHL